MVYSYDRILNITLYYYLLTYSSHRLHVVQFSWFHATHSIGMYNVLGMSESFAKIPNRINL